MRPLIGIIILVVIAVGIASYTSSLRPAPDPTPQEKAQEEEAAQRDQLKQAQERSKQAANTIGDRATAFDRNKEGAIRGTLEIEGKGKMTLELYPKAAPKTVAHVVDLANKGFYNGILFHRVVAGYVVQAGDPASKNIKSEKLRDAGEKDVAEKYHLGGGGSGSSVPLEAVLPHVKYSIGLARSQSETSGDSQFYINLNDNSKLDGNYCVFGRVVEGTEIVDKIQQGDKIARFSILK